jgi:thiol-disulfide isomerase/thioredoxin
MYLVTVFTTLLCSAIGVTSSPSAVAQQPNAIDPQAIKLEHLDQAKLERLICSRKGRALFINVWATWCAPCVEEFPDIVKLAEDLRDQPIDFIAVSGDDFDKAQSTVIPFLMKHKVRFKVYIAKLEGEDQFIDAFDKDWGGGIPATFTFDERGHRQAYLLGKQSFQNLKAAADRALMSIRSKR